MFVAIVRTPPFRTVVESGQFDQTIRPLSTGTFQHLSNDPPAPGRVAVNNNIP
jgi:hypothetical protein